MAKWFVLVQLMNLIDITAVTIAPMLPAVPISDKTGIEGQLKVDAAKATQNTIDASNDLDVVRGRLLATIYEEAAAGMNGVNVSLADEYARSLQPDGSWSDINYTDRSRTGSWQPERHLKRQLSMAIGARQRSDTTLIAATNKALGYWIRADSSKNSTKPPWCTPRTSTVGAQCWIWSDNW